MKKILIGSLLAAGMMSGQAMAAVAVKADYGQVTGSGESTDPVEFDTYDFEIGSLLIRKTGAGTVSGYYQSAVTTHSLAGSGVGPSISDPSTAPYELTVAAKFTATFVELSGNVSYTVQGGTFEIFYDEIPDRDYTGTGSGFDSGLGPIMTGTFASGTPGFFNLDNGVGFSFLISSITADSSVFSPLQPVAGESIFGLSNNTLPTGANGVLGETRDPNTDILTGADGNLIFTQAVPIPAAAFLLGPVLLGGLGLQRRRGKVGQLAA